MTENLLSQKFFKLNEKLVEADYSALEQKSDISSKAINHQAETLMVDMDTPGFESTIDVNEWIQQQKQLFSTVRGKTSR